MNITRLLVRALALGCLLGAAAMAARAEADGKPMPAPEWRLKTPEGGELASSDFKGKVLVVDFWATWCGPCRTEIPGYSELAKKYGADGLAIVGVSVDQGGAEAVRKFEAGEKPGYPVVLADDRIVEAFGGIEAIPTTFIIDRRGVIRYHKVGAMPAAEFESIVKRYLDEAPAGAATP